MSILERLRVPEIEITRTVGAHGVVLGYLREVLLGASSFCYGEPGCLESLLLLLEQPLPAIGMAF